MPIISVFRYSFYKCLWVFIQIFFLYLNLQCNLDELISPILVNPSLWIFSLFSRILKYHLLHDQNVYPRRHTAHKLESYTLCNAADMDFQNVLSTLGMLGWIPAFQIAPLYVVLIRQRDVPQHMVCKVVSDICHSTWEGPEFYRVDIVKRPGHLSGDPLPLTCWLKKILNVNKGYKILSLSDK